MFLFSCRSLCVLCLYLFFISYSRLNKCNCFPGFYIYCLLLTYSSIILFCILFFYHETLLNSHASSKGFGWNLWNSIYFKISCHLQIVIILLFLYQLGCLYYLNMICFLSVPHVKGLPPACDTLSRY